MHYQKLALGMLWFGALASPAAAQFQYDQIIPTRGTPLNGSITEITVTEVTIDVRGSAQKVPVNEIRRVAFRDDTQELRRGRDAALAGQYETAVTTLRRVDANGIERAEVKQDLQFYLAYAQGRLALTKGGDKNAAVTAMLEFVRTSPDSFHFFKAAELLGDLAVAVDSHDNAVKYYSAIGAKAPWPEYKLRASILEAQALMNQGQFPDARQRYESVIASEVDSPAVNRQKQVARVGRAICLAESGQVDEAIESIRDLIANNDSNDKALFARLYNALGSCYQKADRPKEALRAYLHTDLLFFAEEELHAEALYHLSKLWADAKQPDRASSARNLLLDRYAGSKWAKLP